MGALPAVAAGVEVGDVNDGEEGDAVIGADDSGAADEAPDVCARVEDVGDCGIVVLAAVRAFFTFAADFDVALTVGVVGFVVVRTAVDAVVEELATDGLAPLFLVEVDVDADVDVDAGAA